MRISLLPICLLFSCIATSQTPLLIKNDTMFQSQTIGDDFASSRLYRYSQTGISISSAEIVNNQYNISKQTFNRSDNSIWAEQVTNLDSTTSFALYTSSNRYPNNIDGAFTINQGTGNDFIFKTDSLGGHIGWSQNHGILSLAASSLITNANFLTTGILNSGKGLVVSDYNQGEFNLPSNIQAYFTSNSYGATGIVIENSNPDPNSAAGITIRQQGFTNWIGTISGSSNSNLYSPGSLVIKSEGDILLSTSSPINGNYGQLRFAVNNKEIARFTETSLLIGTFFDITSSALTIESDSRGVLLPRLTTEQVRNISSPEEGIMMYNRDRKKFWFFDGGGYQEICSKPILDL